MDKWARLAALLAAKIHVTHRGIFYAGIDFSMQTITAEKSERQLTEMNQETVIATVRTFVMALPTAPQDFGPETELLVSGVLDSLSIFSLVAALEQEHSVSIPPVDITPDNFGTSEMIANYLRK